MLQIKSYFKRIEERWCSHHQVNCSMLLYLEDIMQFSGIQKNTKDPKVICSTRIIRKRNSSRLDMHREAKNCDLSLENVAVQQKFKRNEIGCSNSSSYIRRLYDVPLSSENIVIPSNGSSYLFKKTIAIPPFEKACRSYPFQNNRQKFSNCSSPKSVDKTQTFFVQEKKYIISRSS